MKFPNLKLLNEYRDGCDAALFNQKININYSQVNDDWINDNDPKNTNAKQLVATNNDIFNDNKNIYAIFENDTLIYIGKTKANLAKERLKNHLFYKNKNTGSKLKNVKESIRNNSQIYISYIFVEPESLRNYIEEELIVKYKPSWNIQGK